MSLDRFIWFKDGPVPSKTDVGKVLEDYLGAIATKVYWNDDRWFAVLSGFKSWPFRRMPSPELANRHLTIKSRARELEEKEERWIEVIIGKNNIDVLTRRQDEATNCLADRFARLVAIFWVGKYEAA